MTRSKAVHEPLWLTLIALTALLSSAPASAQCLTQDDGVSETALGLAAGGEFGWMHVYPCNDGVSGSVAWVQVAYGSAALPGTFSNGGSSRIAIFEDSDDDDDPNTGLVLLAEASTIVTNAGTDLFTTVPFLPSSPGFGVSVVVLVTADQTPGELPAPLDTDHPAPDVWVVGNSAGPGTLDLTDLGNNSLPPTRASTYGAAGLFLLRTAFADLLLYYPTCYGDGSGAACACGNESPPLGGGCANSSGSGAFVFGTGGPSLGSDSFELWATGATPGQPGLFFQGNNLLGPMGSPGIPFGDGLRCCGNSVIRISTVAADAAGCASSHGSCGTLLTPDPGPISDLPGNEGLQPGDTRCYQFWYRDPTGGCGSGFNLSSAIVTIWF